MDPLVAIVVAAAIVGAGIVLVLRRRVRKGHRSVLLPEALCAVTFDDRVIEVRYPGGDTRAIGKPRVIYPQGATGEGELLAEMQRRLADFDNRQLIEAMGSTGNAFFVVWQDEALRPRSRRPAHDAAR